MSEPKKKKCSDWSRAGSTCLSKAFLDALAGGKNLGLELYTKYIDQATIIDNDLCFTGLSRFGLVKRSAIAKLQYKEHDPSSEPAHWSVYSECDVNSVATLVNRLVVIFAYDPGSSGNVPNETSDSFWIEKISEGSGSRKFWLWHDGRPRHVVRDANAETPIAGFVATTGRPRQLFSLSADAVIELEARSYVWFAEIRGPAENVCVSTRAFNGDYLAAVDALLGIERRADQDNEDDVFRSIQDFFLCDRQKLHQRWASGAGCCVALLAYTRHTGKLTSAASSFSSSNAIRFTCLAISSEFSPQDCRRDFADHATPDAAVVCFYGSEHVCLMQDPYRSAALIRHLDTRGLSQKLLNRTDLSDVPRRLPETVVKAAEEKVEASKKKKAGDRLVKKCRCRDCKSRKYKKNMAPAGPDRLCTVPYALSDLLSLLGALDDKARVVVKKMVDLCVASMDIESQTLSVDLEGPRPGYLVEYPEIGGPILEGHIMKTQRPIMIGHTDVLSRERGEKWHDVVSDDTPEAVFAMFARYWLRVCRLKKDASQAKKALSSELKEMAKKYNDAFVAFSNAWVETSRIERDYHHRTRIEELSRLFADGRLDDENYQSLQKDASRHYYESEEWAMPTVNQLMTAFRHTVPGLLDSRLDGLVRRYVVFTFYG